MNELLSIRGLTVRFSTYHGTVNALENLNLDVRRQETLGIVGETGSGKTMTALSILRLVPPPGQIEAGEIMLDLVGDGRPEDLLRLPEWEMRQIRGSRISMIFQEPGAALNPVYTIGDQIAEVILLHRRQEVAERALAQVVQLLTTAGPLATLTRPARLLQRILLQRMVDDERSLLPRLVARIPLAKWLLRCLDGVALEMAADALRDVEIPDPERIVRQYPHQLSGGMKQRAMIAAALACSPLFLIADEPTTSLDVTIQAQIVELLRRLRDERQSSVLYITHDLAVAAELCDRIGVMYAADLCELATTDDLFSQPLHPYTRALMAAVPRPGQEPRAIGGLVADPIDPPPGCRFHPRCSEAMAVCRERVPELIEIHPGHSVACHLYTGEKFANTA